MLAVLASANFSKYSWSETLRVTQQAINKLHTRLRIFLNKTLVYVMALSLPVLSHAELPYLGDPSLQNFSSREEKQLGEAFYQTLRANLSFEEDAQLAYYIDSLGRKLATHSDSAAANFKFFIVRSPAINAFAGPDAYIGINSGLIIQAANESQLASVLAHEIAHVSQRHIARMMDNSGNTAAVSLTAILAAILVGSQSPEAAQAILVTGIAGSQQSSINFTRQNEYEADRVGIGILSDASINPEGMVGFFEILLNKSQGLNLEFLRTHPLSINRVSEAKHRINKINIRNKVTDTDDFQFARARLAVLSTHQPEKLLTELKPDASTVDRYMQALVYTRLQKADRAITLLKSIVDNKRHPWVRLALAEAYTSNRQTDKAIDVLDELYKLYPGYLPVTLQLTDLLLQNNIRMQDSITMLLHQLQTDDKASVHKALARAYHLNGQTTAALESTGDQYLLEGYNELALQQYENALHQADTNRTTQDRLKTKIKQLRHE